MGKLYWAALDWALQAGGSCSAQLRARLGLESCVVQ